MRGLTWEEYHYIAKGYLMRMARQEAWHRNIAASMAGRKVFDSWKIPEIDERPAKEYKPITDEERRIADKIWKLRQTQ